MTTPTTREELIALIGADALAKIEAAGVRCVPVVATEEMLNGARDWSVKKYGIGIGNDAAIGCLSATLDASPFAPERLEG